MTTTQPSVPNHHAHFPGFAGPAGFLAGVTMLAGGKGNARLAVSLAGLAARDAAAGSAAGTAAGNVTSSAADTVADIGCGPGTAARRAARAGAQVAGVDPAPVMLRLARLLTRRPEPVVRYLKGSAEALPLPSASVSVAWSIASVHHWADLDAGLREARRVLKPGGRLIAIERLTQPGATGLASHGWTTEQARAFEACCLEHGFTGTSVSQHDVGRRPVVSVTAIAP